MQIIEERAMRHERTLTGLCIECAIRHHDFSEILAYGMDDRQFSEAPLPAAWIGGRRHTLLAPFGAQGTWCSECNRKVPSVYLPIAE